MSNTRGTAVPTHHDRLYIDGSWVPSRASETLTVVDPTTEESIAEVPAGSDADVDRAVDAAARAQAAWRGTPLKHRLEFLERAADLLESRRKSIAALITAEVGTPIRISERVQASLPVTDLRTTIEAARNGALAETRVGNSLVISEPVGVVAAITPWNYPLHQIVSKIAPALAAGCTMVLKPSEVAPLNAYALFEILDEAGFPAGVVNLLSGQGAVGASLVSHPGVDSVSFTGSTRIGSQIAGVASAAIKRVTLELGGKSPNVILPDADLATAVKVGVANAFLNGGQTCNAWTRMLVPHSRLEEAAEAAARVAAGYIAGDPSLPETKLGPMVSASQRERVNGFVTTGMADGARLVTGGPDARVPARGFFVAPTVFADVDPESTLAQEEIFGPVLSILSYQDEADALRIANLSSYGLHGAVWSADEGRAIAFARDLQVGQVDINGAPFNPAAPFGGFKKSGIGRELGSHGLAEFTETKSIQLPLADSGVGERSGQRHSEGEAAR